MPAKRKAMRKIKEVLRLKFETGFSHERIAAAVGVSKGVVTKYVQRAVAAGLGWPLAPELDDAALEALLFPHSPALVAAYACLAREDASIRSTSGGRAHRRRRTVHPFAQGVERGRAGSAPVLPFAGARAKGDGHHHAPDPALRAGAGQAVPRPREAARRKAPGQDHRAHRTPEGKVPRHRP